MAISKRVQRTAASRERILDAAVEVLVELGYAATSTLEIQRRAAVSRGRLTYHFPSRQTLLVAAVHHLVATRVSQLVASAKERPAAIDSPTRIDRAIELVWETFHQKYFWAATELWLAARHDTELAAALLPAEKALYALVRQTMDDAFGPHFAAERHYRAFRAMLFTSMRGVAITYAFDPRDPKRDPHVARWRESARQMLGVRKATEMNPHPISPALPSGKLRRRALG